ncbi:MAG TPA: DNA topoisomerase III [Bacillota bacterium]|nr:DNA topoisomerase III [Bacillota bacterium]
MKSLILAEKPSVGKEIARVLGCKQQHKHYYEGNQYVVTWALGHLVTLAEPEEYADKYKTWKLEDLPILPSYMKLKVMKETSHQFRAISELSKRADLGELIIATDAGREGELVARWIMEMVRWKKPFKRLWISSQTDQAIRSGFAQLKEGSNYNPLYESAACRAQADWLIGLNVTRALTSKYNAQLSAGRVQTPTLSMLVDREKSIRSFTPEPYWNVRLDLGGFHALWRSVAGDTRILNEEQGVSIRNKVIDKNGEVSSVQIKEKLEPHPLAYDLTELQRDANRKYGFSAKHTSNVLQKLYERHKLVTYPRTDSRYLTTDMVPTFQYRLKGMSVGPYSSLIRSLPKGKLPISKRVIDDSKVTDHHAIIPTEEPLLLSQLDSDEKKLYDLIARRFISLFYPPYRFDEVQLIIEVAEEAFHAKGHVVKEQGWKAVYSMQKGVAEIEDDVQAESLPVLKKGDKVSIKKVDLQKRLTEPPSQFNEAELLGGMEKHNLGTPATRADIIEKLLQTETIERRGNRLHPTAKGMQLIGLVASELRTPEMTAKWELELESIAHGKGNSKKFLNDIRDQTKSLVDEIAGSKVNYKPHNLTGSKCPECGEFLVERKGKKGKMLVCNNRECTYRRAAENQFINKRCPQCHKKMELRTGKAGKYVHCRPCNVIEMLDGEQRKARANKHQERRLLDKYKAKEETTNSLGDALMAAIKQQDHD